MRRTIRLCVAGALAASVVVALPAAADGHVEDVLTGLNNPRDVIVHDGDLYVAESGTGGDGPCYEGGEGEVCYGPTGAVVRVEDVATHGETEVTNALRIHQNLASAADADGAGASGPAGLSVGGDDMLYVTIGLGADPAVKDGEPDLFHLGTLMRGSLDGAGNLEHVADIAGFEAEEDPVPGPYPDSNPFGVVAGTGTAVVVDSGGNTILDVDTTQEDAVTHRASFGPIWSPLLPTPPGMTHPWPAESVPTGVAQIGPDRFLVGELTGFPFPAGGARVHDVEADATTLHTGFTNVMDVAWDDANDALYVLELASEGLASGAPPLGSLIRVTEEGGTVTRELVHTGMLMPGGVAIDGDDAYVTTGSGGPGGTVVRIDLTADPLLTVRDDAAATDEDMRLVVGGDASDDDQFTTVVTTDVTANDEGVETVTPLGIADGAVTTGSIVYQPRRDFHGVDDVPYRGCDGEGTCLNGVLEVTVGQQPIDRIAGIGRMETAVTASMGHYPDGAGTVVVARADLYPDALTGGPLARLADGPILLTQGDVLTEVVAEEIERLAPSTIYVLGGPDAISEDVEDTLDGMAETVTRLGGIDRFETAVEVMAELDALRESPAEMAYVVEGVDPDPNRGWPDAVSVSGLASWNAAPILLVATEVVPDSTAAALDGIDATIIGGEMAINATTRARIAELADDVTEIAGEDRFETSHLIAEQGVQDGLFGQRLILVSGGNWPDALVAGPLAAQNMQSAMMLVHPTDIAGSPDTVEFIDDRGPFVDVDLFGGPAAITDAVADAIAQANQ